MAFEIGDKVLTTAGLYISGEWRERGLKGKVVDISEEFGGLLTVKFKGIEELRFLRPEYLIVRKKKDRPFKEGDTVALSRDVQTNAGTFSAGADAEVIGVVPDSNLVEVKFLYGGAELAVAEEVLTKTEVVAEDPVVQGDDSQLSPEVVAAFNQIIERLDEIKAFLTQGPRQEFVVNVHPSNGLTEEEVAEALREEEPAPEPVFKKAKEVKAGDLLYTEAGAYDKVDRIDTKASGYTSLYGVFGNKIAQIPSGRVVQVLEEVA